MVDYILGLWLLITAALLNKEGMYWVSLPVAGCAVYVLGKKLKEVLGI